MNSDWNSKQSRRRAALLPAFCRSGHLTAINLPAHYGRNQSLKVLWLVVFLSIVTGSFPVGANEKLPGSLTLEHALSFAQSEHPSVKQQLARRQSAQALYDSRDAETLGTQARIIADGRWVEPTVNDTDISHNDSRLHFIVNKRLYDFGASSASLDAVQTQIEAENKRLEILYSRRRIDIAQSFFNVLLADLDFAVKNESMAIEYVRLDRLRDRNRLGQASDIELARQETVYQKQRIFRYEAESSQRITRAKLAEVMSLSEVYSGDLIKPQLNLKSELPEYDELVAQAMTDSPLLLAMQTELEAKQQEVNAARKSGRPVISGELAASDFERATVMRDKYRAGLLLEIPLYTGGRVDARRSEAMAEMHDVEARLASKQMDIRLTLRELLESIQILKVKHERAIAEQDFRDLDLDRARTEYELEFVSDLGNAMADSTAARFDREKAEYELALAWAKIALITGHPEWEIFGVDSVSSSEK